MIWNIIEILFLLAGQSLTNSNLDLRFSSYSFTLLITSANTSVFTTLLVHSVEERLRFSFTDIFTRSWRYEHFNFLPMRVSALSPELKFYVINDVNIAEMSWNRAEMSSWQS